MAGKKFKKFSGPTVEMWETLTGKRPPSGYEDVPENKLKIKKISKILTKELSKYHKGSKRSPSESLINCMKKATTDKQRESCKTNIALKMMKK